MTDKQVQEKQNDWQAAARCAGLDQALAQFPDDVQAAAEAAAKARGAFAPPTNPVDEPWPPMQPGVQL